MVQNGNSNLCWKIEQTKKLHTEEIEVTYWSQKIKKIKYLKK